jgi:hypothetical protein
MARMVVQKYARRTPFVAITFALGFRAAPRGANEKAVILSGVPPRAKVGAERSRRTSNFLREAVVW